MTGKFEDLKRRNGQCEAPPLFILRYILSVTTKSKKISKLVALGSERCKNNRLMIRLSIKRTTTCFLLSLGMATAVYGQVAQIGTTTYTTLTKAFAACNSGETITLIKDADLTKNGYSSKVVLASGKTATLDLNGYSIKAANQEYRGITVNGNLTLVDSKDGSTGRIYSESNYSSTFSRGVVIVKTTGSFTINSGKIYTVHPTDPQNNGHFGVEVWGNGSVIINGGEIEAGWYAIAGSGTEKLTANTNVTINGGTIVSTNDFAIYNPQKGKVTVNAGTIYGNAGGIAMKSGDLEVNGGTITSKGTGDTGNWGDGTGNLENAAINFQNRYADVSATINGGTITAEGNALAVDAPAPTTETSPVAITIKGGTFSGETASIEPYVDEGSLAKDENGKVTVEAGHYAAKVGDVKYESFDEALAAATTGSTVTVLSDIDTPTKGYAVTGKTLTIDINGKNINASYIDSKDGANLILKDGTATTAPVVDEDNRTVQYNAGTLTLKYDMVASGGSKITVESGRYISTTASLLAANGDKSGATEIASEVTVNGGYLQSQEFTVSPQGKGAIANVNGGVLVALDNAVVGGNGTNNATQKLGGTTINITGGTMIGHIKTAGYAACGVYHPQEGVLNISGGKIIAINGCGVLMRGGKLNQTGGEVIATGDAAAVGKVGDSRVVVGTSGIIFDRDANYYDASNTIVEVSGEAKVSGSKAAIEVIDTKSTGADDAITVTGGTFSSDVSDFCENGSTAAPNADGTYGIVSGDIILAYKDKSQTMSTGDNSLEFNTADLSKFVVNTEMTGVNVKMTHNFTTTNWESFFAPFSITITDEMLQKFEFAEIFDTELGTDGVSTTLEFRKLAAGSVIEANTPFIVKALATGEATLDVANADIKKQTSTVYECSTLKQQFTFVGALERTTLKDKYGYYLSKTQQSFRPVESSEVTIAPIKFYMTIQNKSDKSYVYPSTTSEAKTFVFRVIGDETNGINDVNADKKQGEKKVYSLQGTYLGNSLRNLPAGVYIINGKKSVIK